MDTFRFKGKGKLSWLTCTPVDESGCMLHAFSTRLGGVSASPYESLNLGLGTDDDRSKVQQNRARFGRAVGFHADDLVALRQVHGNEVIILPKGRDPHLVRGSRGDALLTDDPGLPLAVITADCFPVALVAPSRPAVGIVHSGRQGTAAQIVPVAIERMCQVFQLHPEVLFAAIGPGIGGCCYEVDDASIEPFRARFLPDEAVYHANRAGHWYLDLQRVILRQMAEAGLPSSHVWCADLCTACHPQWFYSYRREGSRSGRMLNVVMIHSPMSRTSC